MAAAAKAVESPPSADRSSVFAESLPMGWNCWDTHGSTVNETQFKANAQRLADHLKSNDWQYVVVDMEWCVTNPLPAGNSTKSQFSLDEHGRCVCTGRSR